MEQKSKNEIKNLGKIVFFMFTAGFVGYTFGEETPRSIFRRDFDKDGKEEYVLVTQGFGRGRYYQKEYLLCETKEGVYETIEEMKKHLDSLTQIQKDSLDSLEKRGI